MKYLPIQDALCYDDSVDHENYTTGEEDDVVYLDMDTLPQKPIPADFWDRLRQGPTFRCCYRQGTRIRCPWRGGEDSRKTPCGSLMYFRGYKTIRRMMELYDKHRTEWDLHVLAMLGDELQGGWRGVQAWKDEGYEPWFHQFRPGQIFAPNDLLFISSRKPGLRAKGLLS